MRDISEFSNYLGNPFKPRNQPQLPTVKDNDYYIKMVETCYGDLTNIKASEHIIEDDETHKSWELFSGNVVTYIYLNFKNEIPTLRVLTPLVYMPQSNILPMYRECLELNNSVYYGSICIIKDVVFLVMQRPLDGLDAEQFKNIILYFAGFGDDLDDKLAEKFGAQLYKR